MRISGGLLNASSKRRSKYSDSLDAQSVRLQCRRYIILTIVCISKHNISVFACLSVCP
jgi:hypothetical protein